MSEQWPDVGLDEVCERITDGTHHSPTNLPTGAYRYITAKNIRPWGLDLSDISYVDEKTHREIYARCPVERDDVLYIKDGVTTGLAVVNPLAEPFSMLSSVALLKPQRELLDSSYLRYWLNSPLTVAQMTSEMTGTAIKRLVLRQIRAARIPLPPIRHQRLIAAKLDSLLLKIDTSRERLNRVPQILKKFREAVLEAAVSGRLTEEWRVSANASHIDNELHCIDAVRKNSWRNHNRGVAKKSVEPLRPFLDKIPPNWRWVSLDRLALLVVDGTHYTPTYVAHGVPFISVKDIRGEQIHMDNCKYISAAEHKELSKRCHAQTGDLLVTKSGTIGRVAVVGEEGEFSLFVSVALVKPVPDLVSTHYLSIAFRAWLNSIDVASEITGTGIKNLHIRDLRRVPIPLPPLEEQRRIVRRADELIERECRLRGRYEMIAARIGKLTPSVLAQAFRGELVPQDPNDEPMGEMLERVRAVHAGETAPTMKIRAARNKGS